MSGALDVELQYAKLRRTENRADHTDFALIAACEEIKDLEQQLSTLRGEVMEYLRDSNLASREALRRAALMGKDK